MLTPDDLRLLVAADGKDPSLDPDQRRDALRARLAAVGADDAAVVEAAVTGLDSDDRNVRAAMLRVLGLYERPAATAGILRGLADPARRVREIAIRATQPHHLRSQAVIDALRRIMEDEAETGRLRRTAFFVLWSGSPTRRALPDVAEEGVGSLLRSDRFRRPLLRRLCTSFERTPATTQLLREFVRTGTKDEAVMATRALCGQVLLRIDAVAEPERRRVRDGFDREDELHHWVPAAVAIELVDRSAEAAPDRR